MKWFFLFIVPHFRLFSVQVQRLLMISPRDLYAQSVIRIIPIDLHLVALIFHTDEFGLIGLYFFNRAFGVSLFGLHDAIFGVHGLHGGFPVVSRWCPVVARGRVP